MHTWEYEDRDGGKVWADERSGDRSVEVGVGERGGIVPVDKVRELIEFLSEAIGGDDTREADHREAGMEVTYHVHLPVRDFTGSALPTRMSALIARAAMPGPMNSKAVLRRTVITEDVTYE